MRAEPNIEGALPNAVIRERMVVKYAGKIGEILGKILYTSELITKGTTAVMLQDVLYCLDIGYTLVSLAKCNAASFTVLLKDKSCCIKDSKGFKIGRIFQYHGRYHMDKEFSEHIVTYRRV